jgi:peptide-N4-(N-acetyl-beta-glucosaminyl)asparagine amidase
MNDPARKPLLNLFVNQPRWANPDESIGEFIKSIDGKNSCWKAKGPAREAFEILATDIQTYLNKCVDPIEGSDWVTFSIYMVGKTSQKAAPVVMFFCEESRPRRRVQEVIKKSGILKRYPGIKSGHAARPPDLDKLEQLSSKAIFYQDTEKAKGSRPKSPISVSGNKVFVTSHQGNISSSQIATLGGIVHAL